MWCGKESGSSHVVPVCIYFSLKNFLLFKDGIFVFFLKKNGYIPCFHVILWDIAIMPKTWCIFHEKTGKFFWEFCKFEVDKFYTKSSTTLVPSCVRIKKCIKQSSEFLKNFLKMNEQLMKFICIEWNDVIKLVTGAAIRWYYQRLPGHICFLRLCLAMILAGPLAWRHVISRHQIRF